MRQLIPPAPDEVDAYEAYRPSDPQAPLLRINMVTSLDGHIADADGVSGDLGGAGDELAFFAMRHLADAVVAGAGTVRAEGYGPMRVRSAWADRRRADGREGPAPIVVVTASVDLDPTSRLFTDAVAPTVVLTTVDAPADRVAAVRGAGGVVVAVGEGRVDLRAGIAALREDHGLTHLLVEGGPTLNGQLLDAGLVDEVCTTIAPAVTGGAGVGRLATGVARRHDLALTKLLEHDGELLLTYAVRRG